MKNRSPYLRILLVLAVFGKLDCSPIPLNTVDLDDLNYKHELDRSLWSELLTGVLSENVPPGHVQKSSASDLTSTSQDREQNAVDSIEDAILAALEVSKVEEGPSTPSVPSTPTSPEDSSYIHQEVITAPPAPVVPIGVEPVDGVRPGSTEAVPGEYIAGIFGSLGQANLGGIIDNTLKLAGTGAVQSFLSGIADTFTCQITPGCRTRKQKK